MEWTTQNFIALLTSYSQVQRCIISCWTLVANKVCKEDRVSHEISWCWFHVFDFTAKNTFFVEVWNMIFWFAMGGCAILSRVVHHTTSQLFLCSPGCLNGNLTCPSMFHWSSICSPIKTWYGSFLKWGYLQIIHVIGTFHFKLSIWGYLHSWKPPYFTVPLGSSFQQLGKSTPTQIQLASSLVPPWGPSEKKQPGPGACPTVCSADLTNWNQLKNWTIRM